MLPLELENWLTEEGDRVVTKEASATGKERLTPIEQLIIEVWLLDTEQRNGGLSQYFANRGVVQWRKLSKAAKPTLPSFSRFAEVIDDVIKKSKDPYLAVIKSEIDLDERYRAYQIRLVSELKSLAESKRSKRN